MTGLIVAVILFSGTLLLFFVQRIRTGSKYGLRSLRFSYRLRQRIRLAAESGGLLHVTLGRAGLTGAGAPASIVGLLILDDVTQESSRNEVPALLSSGDGSLFVASQSAGQQVHRRYVGETRHAAEEALFLAPEESPLSYAAGVSWLLNEHETANNVAAGGFGGELGIIVESASRAGIEQFIGTDEPTAMAVAAAASEDILLGEELYAAPAYLDRDPARLASLRVQDVLRWLAVGVIIIAVILNLLGIWSI